MLGLGLRVPYEFLKGFYTGQGFRANGCRVEVFRALGLKRFGFRAGRISILLLQADLRLTVMYIYLEGRGN